MERENIRDYLNRLNGYARNAIIKPQEVVNDYLEGILRVPMKLLDTCRTNATLNISHRKKSRLMTLMLRKTKELSRVQTTMNVELLLTELSLEVISVHNKVEHLQVDLIKVVIDLLLVKVCNSVTIVLDEASQNLSMDHAPPVEVSIIRPTIASVDANCQCEAFNELAKIPRTKVDKNDISPELQKIVFGCLPTETGLDPIGQPQSAEQVIDADCIYAYIRKCNYPDEDNDYCMNTTGFEKERDISLGGDALYLETEVKITQDGDEYRWEKVAEPGAMVSVHAKMVKLLPGERIVGGRQNDLTNE
ncbi:hypothetical protein PHMEG_00030387 [Phytophthora megakarya]|uniref:Uncharacterized protein n=1 Tax=Phytophthora megakarya TaxID=4795 RepID=A0A225V202_9STRA|nr:hypothetical protein PHMEG_00030387 [Phytophthora megakarya]